MKRLSLALLLSVLACGVVAKGHDIDKVNGSVRTEAGLTYGDLQSVNGSVDVNEQVIAEDVSTVNGSIRLRDGSQAETVETVNGGVKLGRNVVVNDDVSTVNGRIDIAAGSRISGGIESVNGSIEIDAAEIGKGIETVNADLTLGNGTIVHGGILYEKPSSSWFGSSKQRTPKVVIGANVQVDGDLVFKREVELFIHDSAKIGRIDGATAKRFSGRNP